MEQRTPIPTSLVIVAVLFILGGVCSATEVVVSLMHDHLNINLGVLVIIFIISLWQYWVLRRSDVKRLFGVM